MIFYPVCIDQTLSREFYKNVYCTFKVGHLGHKFEAQSEKWGTSGAQSDTQHKVQSG